MLQIMMSGNMSKIKYVIATPDKKEFYKVTEWESDMSGFGGSTSTEYTYKTVKTLEEASIFNKDPTNIMKRYIDHLPFIVLRVRNIMELVDE
jgi:hypothetical protein